jgi:NAD(P)-dependent dehydrogenase (short-subunit alcohol dehydrogenase family)
MAEEMAGKVAVVTGAARGLGFGIAKLFVEEGGKVVIADVLEPEGKAAAASLGDSARFLRTDVSQRDQVQALVDFAVSEYGGLHAMVNNAGVSDNAFGRFLDDDFARFEPVVTVGIMGTLLCTQIAARHMARNGGGSIVNISSIGGVRAGAGFPIYRTVKAGIIKLTESTAIDLGEYGIRVNAVCPGNVPSDMGVFKDSPGADAAKLKRIAEAIRDVRLEMQPIKREGTPGDIANAVLYFASDRSSYVSGQILSVDGGAMAGDAKSLIAEITQARQRVEAE